MIDKLLGGSIGLLLGCVIGGYGGWYVTSDHYQKQIAEFDAAQNKALADARKAAADIQAKQDAVILDETKQALGVANDALNKSQTDYATLKAHTKAVSDVPEVKRWRCTPIPAALLSGLSDGPGSRSPDCDSH